MDRTIFTDDLKLAPYWWDATPRPELPETEIPKKVDVAIIGSGYTGLCAALQTARAGRSTVVFDAEDAGWGCSSRNGGQVSTSIKPGFDELARLRGAEAARAILGEGQNALAWIKEFVANETIDCSFKVPGRFHAAHNAKQYEKLAHEISSQPKGLEVPAYVVSRQDQHKELGSDAYHGGVIYEAHAALDPAAYHQGILQRVQAAGVDIHSHCPVQDVEATSAGYLLSTAKGKIRARDVVVATNGYTGTVTPWQRRRVIPIGSYIIATEELPEELMNRLMPKDRVVSDSRKVVYYYRPSPDRRRILFGGRVSTAETDPLKSAPLLRRDLIALFPELSNVRVSHSWMGFVAYTFDTLAHVGKQDGIHYAMGYCGSGVSMAGYLGTRIGQQVLGLAEGKTAFDAINFQTRPFYTGNPWFLAASIAYYRWRDRKNV